MKPARAPNKGRAPQNPRSRVGMKKAGVNAPSLDSRGSAVRVIEDGVDLTPLPLRLPVWKLQDARSAPVEGEPTIVKAPPATSTHTLPTNEELSAVEVSYDGDDLTDDNATKRTDQESDAPLVQYLVESSTDTVLHISGVCVATDFVGKQKIEERNTAYDKMVAQRSSSDRYVVRHCQTINQALKDQGVMAKPPKTCDACCQSTSWDIYDANAAQHATTDSEDHDDKAATAQQVLKSRLQKETHKTVSVALASPDFLLDVSEAKVGEQLSKLDATTSSKAGVGASPSQSVASSKTQQQPPETEKSASAEELLFAQKASEILASRKLATDLARMERCVQQNLFHAKQLQYRDHQSASKIKTIKEKLNEAKTGAHDAAASSYNDVRTAADDSAISVAAAAAAAADDDDVVGSSAASGMGPAKADVAATSPETEKKTVDPATFSGSAAGGGGAARSGTNGDAECASSMAGLEVLWAWSVPMTTGRCVTSMSWNRVNQDVLAVAYGGLSYAAPTSGLVLFWSLRNPLYPERVLTLSSGCTAIDFSRASPQLLAVGMHDGTVAIYNVRRDENGVLTAPVLDSENTPGKHMDPVWQVQWVDKGAERGESLVSISTDGRVVEWSMKKGLEESTLMVLKRVGNSEGVISRQASGLCFDFPIDDASIYLAGTEDGLLHRCSCSYNEQYLETYAGHTAPVYRIRCSPFWPPAFLSCSADWTVKLWHQKHSDAAHSFHSVDLSHVVHDVAWSPRTSTVFASVAGDGRIEIWDLKQSTLDPIIRQFPSTTPSDNSTAMTKNDPSQQHRRGSRASRTSREFSDDPHGATGRSPSADRTEFTREPVEVGSNAADPAPDVVQSTPSSTAVLFANTAPVLVVGDSAGSVTCYCIKGMGTDGLLTNEDQVSNLKSAMFPEAKV